MTARGLVHASDEVSAENLCFLEQKPAVSMSDADAVAFVGDRIPEIIEFESLRERSLRRADHPAPRVVLERAFVRGRSETELRDHVGWTDLRCVKSLSA